MAPAQSASATTPTANHVTRFILIVLLVEMAPGQRGIVWHKAPSLADVNPSLQRKDVHVPALGEQAPESLGEAEHRDHGEHAEEDHVPGTVVGQSFAQTEEEERAHDRA